MNDLVYTDLLDESIREHASLPCFHIKRKGGYVSWTYYDFRRDLNRLVSALMKQGLTKGSNAVVIGENSPEWTIAYHGIILSGSCTVPVDPNLPASEIESVLSATEARLVFCSGIYLDLFRSLRNKYSFLDRIILLEPHTEEPEGAFYDFLAEGDESFDAFSHRPAPDDPIVIIFTSGTTGRPKGAVLCQKNFTVVGRHAVRRMKVTSDDTVCAVLPLHHVFGFAAAIAGPLIAGMDIVFVPVLKGALVLEALNEKKVTYLPAVPKMLQLFYDNILRKVEEKGPVMKTLFNIMQIISAAAGGVLGNGFRRKLFSSVHKGFGGKLRLIISGGAALSKTYWNGFRRLGFDIVEGYGLTETFGPITVCPADKPKLGSVGPALPENEIRIVDADCSGVGEVWLRGSCVFRGYYGNKELTDEVLDADGWFHSGDLGRVDKDGYLFLCGRKKDVIVLDSGKNIYPDELEDYYGASPLIEEIGIFGVQDDKKEIAAAVVVPQISIRKTKTIDQATEIINGELLKLGKKVPSYRRISDFVVSYSPLPRTTTRKLKKNEVRLIYDVIKKRQDIRPDLTGELTVIETAMMKTDEYRRVVGYITNLASRKKPEKINPRSSLEADLGLDSLDRLELVNLIEKGFSIKISEEKFDKIETISELVSMIRDIKAEQIDSSDKSL